MLGLNSTTTKALGLPPAVAMNITVLIEETLPLLSRPVYQQLIAVAILLFLPTAALFLKFRSSSSSSSPSSPSSLSARLSAKIAANAPEEWMRTYRSFALFTPYFVPTSRESARGLALNLTGMATCLVLHRIVNLLCPLLMRHIVDSLSLPVAAAVLAANNNGTLANGEGSSNTTEVAVEDYFPWRAIVTYVLAKHLVASVIRRYEWALERRIYSEAGDRIANAAYKHLLTLGADFHEGGAQSVEEKKKKKEEEEKAKENKNGKKGAKGLRKRMPMQAAGAGGGPSTAWLVVVNSAPATARFIAHALFEFGPGLLDLVLGVAAFWRVSGGRVAGAMSGMLIMYLAALFIVDDSRRAASAESREVRSVRTTLAVDAVRNWSTVSLFAREGHEEARFVEASKKLLEAENKQHAVTASFFRDMHQMVTSTVLVGGLMALGLTSAWQIRHEGRSVGDFIMLMQYWLDLVNQVRSLLYYFTMVDDFVADVDKLTDVLERKPSVQDSESAREFQLTEGAIEFRNVGFSYPGAKKAALENVSFSVKGGQTVAVVGETGGGKSTLLKLLCRFRDPSSGSVRIDGQDVRDVTRASLLQHVAVVPQTIGIFGATVSENVSYGNLDSTQADVEAACRAARLHDKISSSFAGGYEEKVGSFGSTQLSGGEAQRLAIARALVRGGQGARIVLFDEAMSSLDAETEWEIQKNVREWSKGRTVVIISHRLATVAHADLILAVKDGRVVEAGTQQELLKKEGYYHSLWTKQRLE